MKCTVMYQYPTCDMHFVIVKDELISEISFGILYIFKRYNVFQKFSFNLVEFTNRHGYLTSLHLRSFRRFQNLSEETWSRAAENLIELCFLAFLSNTSKKCFRLI